MNNLIGSFAGKLFGAGEKVAFGIYCFLTGFMFVMAFVISQNEINLHGDFTWGLHTATSKGLMVFAVIMALVKLFVAYSANENMKFEVAVTIATLLGSYVAIVLLQSVGVGLFTIVIISLVLTAIVGPAEWSNLGLAAVGITFLLYAYSRWSNFHNLGSIVTGFQQTMILWVTMIVVYVNLFCWAITWFETEKKPKA